MKRDKWFPSRQLTFPNFPDARIVYRGKRKIYDLKAKLLVIEFPPAIRPILEIHDQNHIVSRDLAFPYIYMCIYIDEEMESWLYVFFRNSPLTQEDSALYRCPLPNISIDGEACIPWIKDGVSFDDAVKELIENFWSSPFNRELTVLWSGLTDQKLPASFSEWEQRSRIDRSFMLKVKWVIQYTSLDDWMNSF